MGAEKNWHLVCYDVRDPQRWARVYRTLKGTGEHIQLSVFRVHLSGTQLEKLRLDLKKIMDEDPAVREDVLRYQVLDCRSFPGGCLPK